MNQYIKTWVGTVILIIIILTNSGANTLPGANN